MKFRAIAAIALSATIAAGCTPTQPIPIGSTAADSPSARASLAPVPSPAASTSAAAPAQEDCSTVLTDAEYASLENDGLTPNPDLFVLEETMQSMLDAGGLGCYWTRSNGDVRVWYAQVASTDAEWDVRRTALIDAGWTPLESTDDVLQAPTDDDDDYIPAVTYDDGTVYYASYATFLDSVRALND